jgi:hypothetical protein
MKGHEELFHQIDATEKAIASDLRVTDFVWVRQELAQIPVTLDGKPAYIGGIFCQFPTVWQPGEYGQSVQFSWPSVHRTMRDRAGAFKS